MIFSGQAYKCVAGDTFDRIALYLYGNEKYAAELLCMNPTLCTTMVFSGGEVLLLPQIEMPETELSEDVGEYSYMPARAPWKE